MLVSMQVLDFCCFKQVRLDLKKQGLIWVSGENHDTEAAISNGSGKSTLFKALTWVLFGQTIDGERGDGIIRHGAREAHVQLEMDGGWLVDRHRKRGSAQLSLSRHGAFVDGDKKAIQDKIIDLVGLDFHAFKNTVLFGQNDTSRFASPRTSDAERKDMLHRLMRTGILKDCHKIALARVRETKEKMTALFADESSHQRSLEEAEARAISSRAQKLAWDVENAKKVDAELEVARQLKDKANKAMRESPDVAALRDQEQKLQEAIAKAERARELASGHRMEANELRIEAANHGARAAVATSTLTSTQTELDELDGELCPVCSSPLDGEHAARHIATLEADRDRASQTRDKHKAEQRAFLDQAKTVEDQAVSLEAKAKKLPAYRKRLTEVTEAMHTADTVAERAKGLVKRARMHLQRSKDITAEVNPHTVHHDSAIEDTRKAREALKKAKKELYMWSKLQAHQDFWARGFSGQGLPSFILDAVVPMISDRANKYLSVLSDGDITIDVSTQRELKATKGKLRDEIDIQWVIEGMPGYPPSGGQQRKMEIAIDLALMDLAESREGTGLDIFIADEILDGLDDEGTARVVQLLQVLRKRRGTIFVVSHQPAMSEAFERSIRVVKDGGSSILEISK